MLGLSVSNKTYKFLLRAPLLWELLYKCILPPAPYHVQELGSALPGLRLLRSYSIDSSQVKYRP
jgi:hypothetical protein